MTLKEALKGLREKSTVVVYIRVTEDEGVYFPISKSAAKRLLSEAPRRVGLNVTVGEHVLIIG